MRTRLLILGGSALFGVFLLAAMLFGDDAVKATGLAIRSFVGLWFFAMLANLWLILIEEGPGHSFKEVFPGFLMVLAVPITVALMVPWDQLALSY
jgi:hypothetical protein